MPDSQFSDTLQLIYQAGLDSKQWPAVLERLGELLGASMTCLVRHDVATSEGAMIAVRANSEVARRYAEHYAKLNVFAQRAGNRPAETCMTDRAVLAKEELFKTEFYADFLRPEDVHSILSVYVLSEDGTRVAFGRPHSAGEWEQEHIDLLRRFAPHLHRAALINLKLGAAQLGERSSAEALDRLTQGVILVDADSRPLFINKSAAEILAEADGLCVDGLGLCAAGPSQTATIRRMICAASSNSSEMAAGGVIGVSRRSMRRPLSVVIAPMHVESSWFCNQSPAAIVFVSDPERSAPVPLDHLQQYYGLKPAEATVAIEVLRGKGLQAAAATLGVTASTVRTHLQHVFEKTRTADRPNLHDCWQKTMLGFGSMALFGRGEVIAVRVNPHAWHSRGHRGNLREDEAFPSKKSSKSRAKMNRTATSFARAAAIQAQRGQLRLSRKRWDGRNASMGL